MSSCDEVRETVKKYYEKLESSSELQTTVKTCGVPKSPLPRSLVDALALVHPEISRRFLGCGIPFPAKLEGCKVLDLGSGSGRDCFAFSKRVGPSGYVTGIDMTEELVSTSLLYVDYHQQQFGYEKPNVTFVEGYMEKLTESGIQKNSIDIVISNCVLCLCPDKKAVLQQAYEVLKDGGELYYSDMYSDTVIPDHMKEDPRLWVEGLGGSLFWRDLIPLVREVGFSTLNLVAARHISIVNKEFKEIAGDIKYASGTYRLFKLPKNAVLSSSTVTYKGTVTDCPDELEFDSTHCFKTGVPMEVNGEMTAIIQNSRFSSDFEIQMLDKQKSSPESDPEYRHLDVFLLADKQECVQQCSGLNEETAVTGEKY